MPPLLYTHGQLVMQKAAPVKHCRRASVIPLLTKDDIMYQARQYSLYLHTACPAGLLVYLLPAGFGIAESVEVVPCHAKQGKLQQFLSPVWVVLVSSIHSLQSLFDPRVKSSQCHQQLLYCSTAGRRPALGLCPARKTSQGPTSQVGPLCLPIQARYVEFVQKTDGFDYQVIDRFDSLHNEPASPSALTTIEASCCSMYILAACTSVKAS